MKANGFTKEPVEAFIKGRMFSRSLVFAVVMSINLAMFLATGVVALFENKSWRYIRVNTGYNIVAFVLMVLIIGAWR